ncbi:MAG: YMGG-like glycine zipper-containing protein [Bryobacteraceae bacterium]
MNDDSKSTYSAPANSGDYVVTNETARKTPWYKSRTAKSAGIGAGGGAVFGALTGGKKGAAIGALIGGGGGYVYDRVTKDKNKR